jgi:hypothetical protein
VAAEEVVIMQISADMNVCPTFPFGRSKQRPYMVEQAFLPAYNSLFQQALINTKKNKQFELFAKFTTSNGMVGPTLLSGWRDKSVPPTKRLIV